jgi:hypothetical protein
MTAGITARISNTLPGMAGMAVFLMLSLSSLAQKVEFSGKVIDFDTKAPVAGITVSIPSINKSTATDKTGRFSFSLEIDDYYLSFTSVEYKTTT